jgi:hypothetical protein
VKVKFRWKIGIGITDKWNREVQDIFNTYHTLYFIKQYLVHFICLHFESAQLEILKLSWQFVVSPASTLGGLHCPMVGLTVWCLNLIQVF